MDELRATSRDLAKVAHCLLIAKADGVEPSQVAERLYRDVRGRDALLHAVLRSAVGTHTTQSGDPGSELASPRLVAADFAAQTRELSLMGKLASVRMSPFTPIPFVSARSRFSFVAEGQNIPAAKPTFGTTTLLRPKSIKGTAMLTKEYARSARGLDAISRMMIDGTVEGWDVAALDGVAASAARPASLVALASEIYSGAAATDVAGADNLFRTMCTKFLTTGASFRRAAWLTSSSVAVALAGMRATSGGPAYPQMNAAGGQLLGIPIYASDWATQDTLVLVDGSALILADDDAATIEVSDSALLYMSDDANSHPVSAFSADALALKVVREVNWDLQGARAVAAINLALPDGNANTA
jgi:HK97 family phage major capsid protein